MAYAEVPGGGALVVVVVRDAPIAAALVHLQVAEGQVLAERAQRERERVRGRQVREVVAQVHAAGVRRLPRGRRLARLEDPVALLLKARKIIWASSIWVLSVAAIESVDKIIKISLLIIKIEQNRNNYKKKQVTEIIN